MKRLAADLVRTVEANDEEWVGPPERRLLDGILMAMGPMDTARSHLLLVHLLRNSQSHLVRADALEAMAFEKERFDFDLVRPFASDRVSPPEILSALYALRYYDYANRRPEGARECVSPLLRHEHPMVRVYGIELLMLNASNLDLILPLGDDPSPHVRKAVAEAAEWIA